MSRKTAQRRQGRLRAYGLSLGDLNGRETAKLHSSDPSGKTLILYILSIRSFWGSTMTEALGVAGSVVGIVSLGIQLTQGLLKYYGSWKDQDNDISDMCASLDSLQRTLTILSKTIQAPAKFGMSIKDSVEKNVNHIRGALEKFKDELRKVQGTESPKPGARSAMRRHVRRALYPFKEETLSKIQRVVSEACATLDLALQVLQVFVYLRFISDVSQRLS